MKKIVCLLAMVLVCSLSWAQTQAAPAEPTSVSSVGNGELIARAFLSHEIVRYEGWFNFQRVFIQSGKPYWVSGNFSMTKEGWITALSIDGVTVLSPGDKPLAGLPANEVGSATWYTLGLNGVDSTGQFVVYGNFSTSLLLPGDPILVTLHPRYEERFVPFVVPDGESLENMRLRLGDGSGVWGYDSQRHGFVIWADPSATYTYEIFNVLTGEIYERGDLESPGQQTGDNIVSTAYYGVSAVMLEESQSWDNLQSVIFDNSIERDGVAVPAKVVMTRTYGQPLSVQAIYLPSDGRIEVRAWAPVGEEMPLVSTADAIYVEYQDGGVGKGGSGYYYANLQTPVGYDKLIVTITGTVEGAEPFTVYFSRGGGLGKG